MTLIRKNISLVVAIAIPIAMIVFVAGSIYLPGLFIAPKFNFIYLTGDYYNSQGYYIQDGKLVKSEAKNQNTYYNPAPVQTKLFMYDVTKNESKEISFDDARNLDIDSNAISADGFEISYGNNSGGFFPFFYSGTDYNARYLQGHNISKKINIRSSASSYDFRFLGWINK